MRRGGFNGNFGSESARLDECPCNIPIQFSLKKFSLRTSTTTFLLAAILTAGCSNSGTGQKTENGGLMLQVATKGGGWRVSMSVSSCLSPDSPPFSFRVEGGDIERQVGAPLQKLSSHSPPTQNRSMPMKRTAWPP